MNSFFFWLTVAGCMGGLLAQTFRAGAIELVVVAALANLVFYGWRGFAGRRARAAAG